LPIESLFVPLCESILIQKHEPLWNWLVDGFGNKAVGGPREQQQITAWDLLHPGRAKRATKPNRRFPDSATLEEQVRTFLAGHKEKVNLLSMAEALASAGGPEGRG
jgi:Eco29kI restriction endonuclease